VIGGTSVGDISYYFVVVHSRSIKPEESPSPGGGKRGSLAASLILFNIWARRGRRRHL
jgi:hypothetical protein